MMLLNFSMLFKTHFKLNLSLAFRIAGILDALEMIQDVFSAFLF